MDLALLVIAAKVFLGKEGPTPTFFDLPPEIIAPEDVPEAETVTIGGRTFKSKSECRIYYHKLGLGTPPQCV